VEKEEGRGAVRYRWFVVGGLWDVLRAGVALIGGGSRGGDVLGRRCPAPRPEWQSLLVIRRLRRAIGRPNVSKSSKEHAEIVHVVWEIGGAAEDDHSGDDESLRDVDAGGDDDGASGA